MPFLPTSYELRLRTRPSEVALEEQIVDEALSEYRRDSASRTWRSGEVTISAPSYDGRVPEISLVLSGDVDADAFVELAYELSARLGYEVYAPELGTSVTEERRGEIFENMADLFDVKGAPAKSVAADLFAQGWGSMLIALTAATAISIAVVVIFDLPRHFPLIATITTIAMLFATAAIKRR